jgi:PAS domain S-box-containing protein
MHNADRADGSHVAAARVRRPAKGAARVDFARPTERRLGRVRRLRVASHNLTDPAGLRVKAEDFLAAVSETAAPPVCVVDPDDVIRFASPAAVAVLGYDSADELLGRQSHGTIHCKHPGGTPYPAAECPMRLTRTTGETVARDLDWFFRRDGSMFAVSYVSVAIEMAEGRGAVVAFADIEDRLRAEQVPGGRDAVLVAREGSLRRIAALVAGGAASGDVFAAIAREVAHVVGLPLVVVWRYGPDGTTATVIGAWSEVPNPFQPGTRWPLDGPAILTRVLKTGRPARIDDLSDLPGKLADAGRTAGIRAAAGAPIIVDGAVWGAMSGNAVRTPLPDNMEDRLAEFTELVATAISNAESRAGLARLAEEHGALRRMATLVAGGAAPEEVFAAVTEAVGQLPGVDSARLARYEPDRTLTALAAEGVKHPVFPVGGRFALGGRNLSTLVFETGRPARIDSYEDASGPGGAAGSASGYRSSVGSPIVVERRLWGIVMVASTLEQPLPADTETRLASFAELVATAVASAETRAGVARLAREQTALRRVATLVAHGTRPEEVFAAVANEVGGLLPVDVANVIRYESDDTVTLVASAENRLPVGSRWPLGETTLAPIVLKTGRPARVDNYADATGQLADDIREEGIRSSVAAPIVVEGRVWGQIVTASSREQPLPPDTEERLASFTELVATAIANTEARTEVGRLVDEQAALRRVATLVARGAAPSEVFETVTREVGILCRADLARMERYDSGDSVIGVAGWSAGDAPGLAVGTRFALEGASIAAMVHEASRPVRVDSFVDAHGPIAQEARSLGIRSSVGCPIVVDGHVWGVIAASSKRATPFPPDTESQIAEFTELVATAIANTEARTEVAASRARLVAATDEERRRLVRDLHDGAQQRLVHTVITLKLAQGALENEDEELPSLLAETLDSAEHAMAELRELAHGILPAVLTQGGLRAGVDALASRMPLPVGNAVSVGRLPATVEATAYFVVAEALTNVAKHARAGRASVAARIEDGTLEVRVRDDGVGGALADGSGLVGLRDRLAVLDGRLRVESPIDGGTLVAADIPLSD